MKIKFRAIIIPTTAAVMTTGKDEVRKDGTSTTRNTPPIGITILIKTISNNDNYRKENIKLMP